MLPKPTTNTPTTTDPQHTKQTQTQASEVVQLPDPPKLENISAMYNKAIATIINKAKRNLWTPYVKRKTNCIKRAQSATTTTFKPQHAYNLTAKTNPNLRPYGTQTPTKSHQTNPRLSTYYRHTSKKNTLATTRTTSQSPRGKIPSTRTHTSTLKPTHPHPDTH
jgi:hypothetical protein